MNVCQQQQNGTIYQKKKDYQKKKGVHLDHWKRKRETTCQSIKRKKIAFLTQLATVLPS